MEKKVINESQKQWKNIYLTGGIAAILAFSGILFDIIYGSISSGNLSALPQTAVERFAEFQQSWFLGLYHLDLLNAIIALIMIPTYFALFAVHRNRNVAYAAFAMVLCLFGTTIFISANSALPMLELSNKYYSAINESQKILIAAAGESLLARGGHGSLGAFPGFIFSTIASLNMSLVMLHGRIFSKVLSFAGVIGYMLLLIYVLLVTFMPAVQDVAVIIAAPGGLLVLAWVILAGVKLVKMGISREVSE